MHDYDIFISYSTKDRTRVNRIVSNLRSQGYKVWMDKEGIRSGDPSFKKTIVNAIVASRLVLFFSSLNSNSSDWTEKEIGIAVKEKKYIIPVKLDNSDYAESVRFDLVNCDAVNFASERGIDTEKDKLYSSLAHNLGKETSQERHKNLNVSLMKLAEKYRKGEGVPRDFSFAALLYKKAADQGNATAQCNLATMYQAGLGVEQDLRIAFTLYNLAYKHGSVLAGHKLGMLYFEGECVPKNYNHAIILFQEAARKGCMAAKNKLSELGIKWD